MSFRFHIDDYRLKEQKGVFIPLTAVVVLAVIAVIIGLGIDSSRVKRASALLKQKLESSCHEAVQRPTLQAESAQIFSKNLTSGGLATALAEFGITLTHISMINPTMPNDGSFSDFPGYSSTQPTPVPYLYDDIHKGEVAGAILDFSSLGVGSCYGIITGNDCTFQAKVSKAILHDQNGNTATSQEFPERLWNQTQNVGNTVGCVAYGTVNTLLSGARPISAKVVWQKKLRGEWTQSYDSSNPIPSSPALTILVAPHMTTDESPEMNFSLYNGTDVRPKYDPINYYVVGASTPNPNAFLPAATPLPFPGNTSPILQPKAPPAPSIDSTYIVVDKSATPHVAAIATRDASVVPSQKEEELLACMNPAILVRNTFLSTIVELASRNGQLRNKTQLLLAGTQHRMLLDNSNLDSLPFQPNNPTIMVDFGQDLMGSYQLPYVFYDSGGTTGAIPAAFEPAQGGKINPFEDAAGTPIPFPAGYPTPIAPTPRAELMQHQSLIAGQLRQCYHLYQGDAEDINPLSRFYLDELFGPSKLSQRNFEPPALYDPATDLLQDVNGYEKDQSYEQLCPWPTSKSCDMGYTRGLNGAELMSALGSIQQCPYQHLINSSGGTGPDNFCEKPPRNLAAPAAPAPLPAPLDLRPDLLGAFYYLSGSNLRGAANPPNKWGLEAPTSFEAVRSPGLYPFVPVSASFDTTAAPAPGFNDARDNWYPLNTPSMAGMSIYQRVVNARSHVLLVTHQRLSAAERDAISKLFDDLDSFGEHRPLTVIYIPTTPMDNDQRAVNDMRKAFHIPDSISPDSNTENALYVYGPGRGICKNLDFEKCWAFLLTNANNNIQKLAAQIYYDRLLKTDLVF